MKVYIGPYVNRWVSYVHYGYMNKKYNFQWDENNTRYERFLERLEDVLQWIYNHTINLYLDKQQRNVKVKLHKYDTWSMDHTLSLIVLPMLKQLKEKKQGSPAVEEKDVPEELWPPQDQISGLYQGDIDNNYHKRWEYVLDEMIWAFEMKAKDDWEEPYYGTWIKDESKPLGGYSVNTDYDGMQEAQKRISNGLRLFGKYYENLWD